MDNRYIFDKYFSLLKKSFKISETFFKLLTWFSMTAFILIMFNRYQNIFLFFLLFIATLFLVLTFIPIFLYFMEIIRYCLCIKFKINTIIAVILTLIMSVLFVLCTMYLFKNIMILFLSKY